jgi:hypothetical protein
LLSIMRQSASQVKEKFGGAVDKRRFIAYTRGVSKEYSTVWLRFSFLPRDFPDSKSLLPMTRFLASMSLFQDSYTA